jgi:hypothetical protein
MAAKKMKMPAKAMKMPAKAPKTKTKSIALPTQPNPTSIFVLFEGPWIIDQLSQGVLRATTFKNLPVSKEMGMEHNCVVGFGDSAGNLTSPIGTGQPDLMLPGGATWCITTPVPLISQQKQIADLFDVPFNKPAYSNVFVYAPNEDKSMCVTPCAGEDRVVLFPTPDNVYMAGPLLSGTVNDAEPSVLKYDPNGKSVMPFVTAIFEYTKQSGADLTLTMGGSAEVPLTEGKHLVFRMVHHDDGMTERQNRDHIADSFEALWSRVGMTGSPSLSGITAVGAVTGNNIAGFSDYELGLKRPGTATRNYTPADCGGGNVIIS